MEEKKRDFYSQEKEFWAILFLIIGTDTSYSNRGLKIPVIYMIDALMRNSLSFHYMFHLLF